MYILWKFQENINSLETYRDLYIYIFIEICLCVRWIKYVDFGMTSCITMDLFNIMLYVCMHVIPICLISSLIISEK